MSLLANSHSFKISGPAGELELAVSLPFARQIEAQTTAPLPVKQLAIICHPHPQMGGTMRNKVVTTLASAFNELDLASIRFNYRGVGESSGSYGHGTGEIADLLAVYEWAKQQVPSAEVWLGGFSFGTYVSLAVATQRPISRLISIAPAVHLFDFTKLAEPACPWLIIQGETDDIVDPQQVYDYVSSRQQNPTLIRMPNTGHFFHGQLLNLKQQLKNQLTL